MNENGARSISEVQKILRAEQRMRDTAITNQSFYCQKKDKVVSPAFCHDCFNSLPYIERLLKWHENRMECIKVQSLRKKTIKRPREKKASAQRYPHKVKPRCDIPFSIEEYLCQGFLDYVLDLDNLAERFEWWWQNLAGSTREKVHTSTDLQEMIAWFGQRLGQFQSLVVAIGRDYRNRNNNASGHQANSNQHIKP